MMLRFHLPCLWTIMLAISSAGCCCVQGIRPSGNCGLGACSTGSCGGPLMGFASCKGGCGDVYVDEWISEPPTVDNCGYECGGCGNCGQCRPVRNVLKLLWGRPFVTSCNTGLCGPSCDEGCSSCDSGAGGYVSNFGATSFDHGNHAMGTSVSSGCNCGKNHGSMQSAPSPIPPQSIDGSSMPMEYAPSTNAPQVMPTPAPEIPTSAKRLNPAKSRTIRQTSTR